MNEQETQKMMEWLKEKFDEDLEEIAHQFDDNEEAIMKIYETEGEIAQIIRYKVFIKIMNRLYENELFPFPGDQINNLIYDLAEKIFSRQIKKSK